MKVFIDSDVIVSSLISSTGASFQLINNLNNTDKFISNYSIDEIKLVLERLNINKSRFDELLETKFKIINILSTLEEIKDKFSKYTIDINDSHILAGLLASNSDFLITYNLKHYKIEIIKREIDAIVMTPGTFLQFQRSLVNS